MSGMGFTAPFGFRIYTPDDWVIRIDYPDGTVVRKGVDGTVDRDEAVRVALLANRSSQVPKNIDIRRRRDWNKVQG
jgi:hypothetical protein